VTEGVRTCPACRLTVTADARFCASCGTQVDGASRPSIAYSQPEPRLFGVLAPLPTFVLACIFVVGALFSVLAESWILGVLLLAFAAATFVLFYGAAERDPTSSVARATLGGVGRVSSWTRLAYGSAGAWSGAGRRLLELRRELRPLHQERREVQLALGDAAFRQDEATVASLRARISEIDDAIATRERERTETRATARNRVEDERFAARRTEFLPPDDADDRTDVSH
jgi:hypothetical protein